MKSVTVGLPPELQKRALFRLRVLSMIFGGMALLYSVVTVLLDLGILETTPHAEPAEVHAFAIRFLAVAGVALLLSAGVFLISRSRRLPPERIGDLALALQVLGALCITSAEYLTLPAGVSFVCIWILSFNLVPATPRRAALGAFLAATMGLVGLELNVLWGHLGWPALSAAVLIFLPNYVAATIAVLTAAMVHRLGTDVSRARRLGSYKLIEKLGQGGMGEVWRAQHRSLIRPAAVKVLRRDLVAGRTVDDIEALVHRFRREVQATSQLQSPHTVAVYDFGRSDEGTLYYVMELLNGIDLQSLVRRYGPLPAERVVHVLRQMCHSLADAHRFGLVHRDIKPANVQLCVLGLDVDFVKVLDFGLVKDRRAGMDVNLTIEGVVQGTPAYVAPETAAGGDVDARADLYALGCVAYWLLTGTLVFQGETPFSMLMAHVRKAPEPPSRRAELPIPPALEELVLALLAKDPAQRPQSAAEVARRLDRIPLPGAWTQDRAERWWQVHQPQVLGRCCDEVAALDREAA